VYHPFFLLFLLWFWLGIMYGVTWISIFWVPRMLERGRGGDDEKRSLHSRFLVLSCTYPPFCRPLLFSHDKHSCRFFKRIFLFTFSFILGFGSEFCTYMYHGGISILVRGGVE
jgi:hypothetical protein